MQNNWIDRFKILLFAAFCAALVGTAAWSADRNSPVSIDIPAQSLDGALLELSKQTSIQLIVNSSLVASLKAERLVGTMSIGEALERLLHGSELGYKWSGDRTVTIAPRNSLRPSGANAPGGTTEPGSLEVVAQTRDSSNDARTPPPNGLRDAVSDPGSTEPISGSVVSTAAALDEIVVTAQKRAQTLIEVPFGITALDATTLQRAGIETMLDLSYAVPSLVVQQTGGGFQRYFIRGIANGNGVTSLVGVYLDEADVTNNGNTQLDMRAGDLDRIEVLKGPQGTLYGAGSAGGTVRLITHDPDLSKLSASGDVQAYTTQSGAPSEEFSTVVNVPLIDQVLGLRMAGTYGHLGGWVDQPATGLSNINNQELWDVRVKTLWEPTANSSLKATVEVHRNRGGGTDASADPSYNLTLAVEPLTTTPFQSDFDIYNLTGAVDFADVSLLSSSTYFDSKTSAVLGLKYPVAAPPIPLSEFLNDPDSRDDVSYSEEFRLSSRGAEAYHWLVGAFYKNQTLDYQTQYAYSGGGYDPGSGISIDNEGSKSTSFFVDGGVTVFNGLEVGGGFRFFHDNRTEYDGVLNRSASFHAFDPRLYASYALDKDIHFYADAADGFRSGGFNGGYGLPETTFAPERVRSYEAGSKMSLLDKRLSVDVAVFFSQYDNIQIFANTPNGIGTLQNGGNAHVRGIDWSFAYQATEHLALELSGTVTRSALVSLLPGVQIVKLGDPVDYTTDYTGRVSATYTFNPGPHLPGFFRVDYDQVGPSHLTDRSEGGPPILFRTDNISMLNARMGLNWNIYGIDLFATNLLHANGVQDTAGAYDFGARPRPRTFGLEFRVKTP